MVVKGRCLGADSPDDWIGTNWPLYLIRITLHCVALNPRVWRKGLTTFARRNKACVFSLLYILQLLVGLSLEIPTQHSETRIIARDSQSNRLKFEDTGYKLLVYIEVSVKPSPLHPWCPLFHFSLGLNDNCQNKGLVFDSRWFGADGHVSSWFGVQKQPFHNTWYQGRVECGRTPGFVWPWLWHAPSLRCWPRSWEVALRSWDRFVAGYQGWRSGESSSHGAGHVGMIHRTCGKTWLVSNNQMRSVNERSPRNTPEKHARQERGTPGSSRLVTLAECQWSHSQGPLLWQLQLLPTELKA